MPGEDGAGQQPQRAACTARTTGGLVRARPSAVATRCRGRRRAPERRG
jgi:hypothetical protein